MLPIWKILADTVVPDHEKIKGSDLESASKKEYARVVRLQLDSGEHIVGLSLHSEDVGRV